jgi:hypothetical protein
VVIVIVKIGHDEIDGDEEQGTKKKRKQKKKLLVTGTIMLVELEK